MQLHGSRGSNCGHALSGNTTGLSGLGAGDLVGSRISILWMVSQRCSDKERIDRATEPARTDSITLASRSWPWKPGSRRVAELPAAAAVAPASKATVWKRMLEIDWWLTGVYIDRLVILDVEIAQGMRVRGTSSRSTNAQNEGLDFNERLSDDERVNDGLLESEGVKEGRSVTERDIGGKAHN